jgi:hypothetical protein
MANTASYSTVGITATFGKAELGQLTNHSLVKSHVPMDETDYSHERENNQAGIIVVSGSIDCLGGAVINEGATGQLSLGGTVSDDYGDCIVVDVTAGGSVKGQRTTRYSFASTYIGS